MAIAVVETMEKEAQKNSKSAKFSEKTIGIPPDIQENFQVGKYVKFIDLLAHIPEAWDMDNIDFKILQNYVGKTGKIIEAISIDDIPPEYNLFITIEFSDGYVIYDVSYYAFGPPEFKVYDFEKERLKRSKEEE